MVFFRMYPTFVKNCLSQTISYGQFISGHVVSRRQCNGWFYLALPHINSNANKNHVLRVQGGD